MDKLDYFALSSLIASVVFFIAFSVIYDDWKGGTLRNKIAEMFFILSCITFGLFIAYALYLWISLYFTL